MPKVVEVEPLDLGPATSRIEGGLGGVDRLPIHQEDVWFIQVADLIQVFELSGQVSREGHTPRIIGFSILSLQANEPCLEVRTIPR